MFVVVTSYDSCSLRKGYKACKTGADIVLQNVQPYCKGEPIHKRLSSYM